MLNSNYIVKIFSIVEWLMALYSNYFIHLIIFPVQ